MDIGVDRGGRTGVLTTRRRRCPCADGSQKEDGDQERPHGAGETDTNPFFRKRRPYTTLSTPGPMADVPTTDAREGAHTASGSEPASDDDFLYHLYRGSELLMQDRVVEAKNELERALEMQPQDAKSQDLLAGVYFRLGLYPRAIEIWRRLVEAFPRDATLRVNLSLALLKTGQGTQAAEHIHVALKLQPDHQRAWGYLGLVHWRDGRYDEARDAFLRGGQATMARRMDEVVTATTSPGTTVAAHGESPGQSQQAMRSAAEQAIERFEAEQVPLTVDPAATTRPSGAWRVGEPGAEPTPAVVRISKPLPAAAPPRLESLLGEWILGVSEQTPIAISPAGVLHVQAPDGVYARISGLRALRGELRTTPVQRRARGRDLPELLGEADPILRWHGEIAAILDPPEGASFHGLTLDGELLFVREDLVCAFDARLSYESGRVPLQKGELTLMQLHGEGAVILGLDRAPSALRVTEGEEVRVIPSALVGWTGRLLPRGPRAHGTAPYSASAPPLAFRGDGILLVS